MCAHSRNDAAVSGMNDSPESQSQLEVLLDVPTTISAELDSCQKSIEQILRLKPDTLIRLDKSASSPVDLYANRKRFARGEVVLVGTNLGIRITELFT